MSNNSLISGVKMKVLSLPSAVRQNANGTSFNEFVSPLPDEWSQTTAIKMPIVIMPSFIACCIIFHQSFLIFWVGTVLCTSPPLILGFRIQTDYDPGAMSCLAFLA